MHKENRNPRSTDTQDYRTDKPQSETARPANTRDSQMAKGKCKNITNRNQVNIAPSKPSSPTTVSPRYPNTLEKKDIDLKSYLMMLIEDFKKDLNNSFEEIQKNMGQQVKALKEETQKSLKVIQEIIGQQAEALKEETQKYLLKNYRKTQTIK